MAVRGSMRLWVAMLLLFAGGSVARGEEPLRSPAMERLRLALAAAQPNGNGAAEAGFFSGLRTPIVEAAAEGADRRLVTFVWRGDGATKRVTLLGGRPSTDFEKPLARLAGTNVWYLTELLPSDSRFSYWFTINGPAERSDRIEDAFRGGAEPVTDPLNPNELEGSSYVVLPDAPPFPYPVNPRAPRGEIQTTSFASAAVGAEIALNVYVPPAAAVRESGGKPWLLVVFDGGFQGWQSVLDDLIATAKIPPMVVVGIENRPGMRPVDLGFSEPFARFVAEELLPWARQRYGTRSGREHALLGGVSRGAGQAAFVGLTHPEAFSRILCISTALENIPGGFPPTRFWLRGDDGWLVERALETPRRDLAFFVAAGRFDTSLWTDRLVNNRRFRDALRGKGYPVDSFEAHAGHDQLFFQLAFVRGLQGLTAATAGAGEATRRGESRR